MLGYDNSGFFYIRSLEGTVHSMTQVLRKFIFDDDKDDNRFSIDIGSYFKWNEDWSEFTCIKSITKRRHIKNPIKRQQVE